MALELESCQKSSYHQKSVYVKIETQSLCGIYFALEETFSCFMASCSLLRAILRLILRKHAGLDDGNLADVCSPWCVAMLDADAP